MRTRHVAVERQKPCRINGSVMSRPPVMPVVSPKTKLDAIPGPTTRTTSKGRPVWVSITFWEGFAALRMVAELSV